MQKQIFGTDLIDQMYAAAPADEHHIQRLLSANCFGDHYTRGGLDLPARELLTFATLVAHGGCDPRGDVSARRGPGS
ncbi:MAG: carboxymuconolactone decarboxylase family protein [Propionicimonas sp.]